MDGSPSARMRVTIEEQALILKHRKGIAAEDAPPGNDPFSDRKWLDERQARRPPFQPGQTVQLRSGGHLMTVWRQHEHPCAMVDVVWSTDGMVQTDELPAACLQIAPDEDLPF